jgi:putative ABC transport system substrate-binding protein
MLGVRRRDFITLLGGAAAWPLAAREQQPKVPVIGYLGGGSAAASAQNVAVFRQNLLLEATEGKRLEFLHELLPNAALIDLLLNPGNL